MVGHAFDCDTEVQEWLSIAWRERNVFSVMNNKRPQLDSSLQAKLAGPGTEGETAADRLRLQQLQEQVNELRQAIEEHFARLNAHADAGPRDGNA